ncbi:MAG: WD40 repeat domain-containing protein [Patescibacteria group bacterium]|nr:WD40 repeat domain-containing protein [Patescibacteria group bacterium]
MESLEIGGSACTVAFSGDGRRILTVPDKGPLRVWDHQTGEKIAEFAASSSETCSAAISPDGRRVAVGGCDHTVKIADVDSGTAFRRLPSRHRDRVVSMAFSPDGRWLASGSHDKRAILWNVETGRMERIFPTPVDTEWIAFREDGRRLLTSGNDWGCSGRDGRVVQWDIATRQPVQVIREAVGAAWFVGNDMAVLMPDNELRLYRTTEKADAVETDPILLAPAMRTSPGRNLKIAPSGWQVWSPAYCGKSSIENGAPDRSATAILRSPAGECLPLAVPLQGADFLKFADVSADGTRLLTVFEPCLSRTASSRLVLWDLTAPEALCSFEGTMGCFHPDGQHVLVGGPMALRLYRLTDGALLKIFRSGSCEFRSARFVAGGQRLLTASGDWYDSDKGQVRLWDVDSGAVLRSFFAAEHAAYEAVMDREEKRLFVAYNTDSGATGMINTLAIHDAASANPLYTLDLNGDVVWRTRAHPLSNRFAGDHSGSTKVLDLTDARLLHELPGRTGPFSTDGCLLATHVNNRRATLLWDMATGCHVGSFDMEITGFHPGGAIAFADDRQPSLALLDLRTGRQMARLFTFAGNQWLAVTAEGAMAGSAGALRRVTWQTRQPQQGLQIVADAERVLRQVRPRQVAKVLMDSLPEGRSLIDLLPKESPALPDGIWHRRGTAGQQPALMVRNAPTPACRSLVSDSGGNRLLAAYSDGSAVLWQLRPVQLIHHFPPTGRESEIALTPDSALAIVEGPGSADLSLWDTSTGRRLDVLKAPDEERDKRIAALAMHPQGKCLAVLYHGREDCSPGRTMIWDLRARRVMHQLTHTSSRRMAAIAFTPDGGRLVIGYYAGLNEQDEPWDRIEVWDWQASSRERGIRGSGFGATSLAISRDGRCLLAREGLCLVVRNLQTGELLARHSSQDKLLNAGVLAGDGKSIVGSTFGNDLFRLTVADMLPQMPTPSENDSTPQKHYAHANKLIVMEDRNLVFTPGRDGRIHVWSVDALQSVADLITRNGHRDWITRTSVGAFTATEGARAGLAWKLRDRHWALERFEQWLRQPELVSDILAGDSMAPPRVPAEVLSLVETYVIRESQGIGRNIQQMFADRATAQRLKQAGVNVRIDRNNAVTFVHLERQPLDGDVLKMLSQLPSTERLYLAATGMTDDQLRTVGIMQDVKRLSLWSNPITDAGIMELSAMWSLEVLDVHDTAVTAAGLRTLRLLPKLETLIVPDGIDAQSLADDFDRPGLQIIPRGANP